MHRLIFGNAPPVKLSRAGLYLQHNSPSPLHLLLLEQKDCALLRLWELNSLAEIKFQEHRLVGSDHSPLNPKYQPPQFEWYFLCDSKN